MEHNAETLNINGEEHLLCSLSRDELEKYILVICKDNEEKQKQLERFEGESNVNKFFSFYVKHTGLINSFNEKYPKDFNLFYFICSYCDKKNTFYEADPIKFKKHFGYSESSIYSYLSKLEEHKFLKRKKEFKKTTIIVNSQIMWKNKLSEKVNSKFSETPLYLDLPKAKRVRQKTKTTTI